MADTLTEEGDQELPPGLGFWQLTLRQAEWLLELLKLGVLRRQGSSKEDRFSLANQLRCIKLNGVGDHCGDDTIYSLQIELMKLFYKMLHYDIILDNVSNDVVKTWLDFSHHVLHLEGSEAPETSPTWRRKKWAMKVIVRLVDAVWLAAKRPTALLFESGTQFLKQCFKGKYWLYTNSLGVYYRGRRTPVPEELAFPCIQRYVMNKEGDTDAIFMCLVETIKESANTAESNDIGRMLAECRNGRNAVIWCKFNQADSRRQLRKISARIDLFHCIMDVFPLHAAELLDKAENLSKASSQADRAALIAMVNILSQREELQDDDRLQILLKDLVPHMDSDPNVADPDTWQSKQVVLYDMSRDINDRLEEREYIDSIRSSATELLVQFYEHEQNDPSGHVVSFIDFGSAVAKLIKVIGDSVLFKRLLAAMTKAIVRGRPVESTLEPIEIYLIGKPDDELFLTCLIDQWRSLMDENKSRTSQGHQLAIDHLTGLLTKVLWASNSSSAHELRVRSIVDAIQRQFDTPGHKIHESMTNLMIATFATNLELLHEKHEFSDLLIEHLTYNIVDRDYEEIGGVAPLREKYKLITLLLLKMLSISDHRPVDYPIIIFHISESLSALLQDAKNKDLALYVFDSIKKANPEWYYYVKTSLEPESQELLENLQ